MGLHFAIDMHDPWDHAYQVKNQSPEIPASFLPYFLHFLGSLNSFGWMFICKCSVAILIRDRDSNRPKRGLILD